MLPARRLPDKALMAYLDHFSHLNTQCSQLFLLAAQLNLLGAALSQQLSVGVDSLFKVMMELGDLQSTADSIELRSYSSMMRPEGA